MGEWTWSAYVGIIGGFSLFALFMIPIAAFQYRRYGRFTWLRFFGTAALSVYGVALVAYTLLPLPDPRALECKPDLSVVQWIPFHFIVDIQQETAGLGITATLTSRVVLQVVFNVVLFLPWGIIARRFFSRSILVSTVSGFLASVLIETTQYTGLWGLYDCAWRLADVDDVMANTAGALIGALIAPAVLGFMPQGRELLARRGRVRPVTVWRRWLGMIFDWAGFVAVAFILTVLYEASLALSGNAPPAHENVVVAVLSCLIPGLVVFYIPALFGHGASLGQRMVWLSPAWESTALWRRLLRASVVGGLYSILTFLSVLFPASAAGVMAGTLILAAFVSVPFTRKRGLSGVVAGARMVDGRSLGSRPGNE